MNGQHNKKEGILFRHLYFFFSILLYSQSLLFFDSFYIIVYFTVCLFTSHYSFNI